MSMCVHAGTPGGPARLGRDLRRPKYRRERSLGAHRIVTPSTRQTRWSRLLVGCATAIAVAAAVLGVTLASAQSEARPRPASSVARVAGLTQGEFDSEALRRVLARMDPAARTLARRHDPLTPFDLWGRTPGWESLNLSVAPTLGLRLVEGESARQINASTPVATAPVIAARPFVLRTRTPAEAQRALRCLTAGIYYEAALEPIDGQRAVAQVILNRLRDHNYPKSVCGVVWQGWERWTGCQFSFTCDGSLLRAPMPALWRQAESVARDALNGYVQPQVGLATHYHADYVVPYWAPTLVKITQIGAHIFYRWTGPSGQPAAFTGRYGGGEFAISEAALTGRAPRAPPPAELLQAEGEPGTPANMPEDMRAVRVVDPIDPERVVTRYVARLSIGGRRPATAEDVARINENLRRFETQAAPTPPPAAPTPAPAETAVRDAVPVTEVNRPAS